MRSALVALGGANTAGKDAERVGEPRPVRALCTAVEESDDEALREAMAELCTQLAAGAPSGKARAAARQQCLRSAGL